MSTLPDASELSRADDRRDTGPLTSWYSPWVVWLRKMLSIASLGHRGYIEKQLRARKRRRNRK